MKNQNNFTETIDVKFDRNVGLYLSFKHLKEFDDIADSENFATIHYVDLTGSGFSQEFVIRLLGKNTNDIDAKVKEPYWYASPEFAFHNHSIMAFDYKIFKECMVTLNTADGGFLKIVRDGNNIGINIHSRDSTMLQCRYIINSKDKELVDNLLVQAGNCCPQVPVKAEPLIIGGTPLADPRIPMPQMIQNPVYNQYQQQNAYNTTHYRAIDIDNYKELKEFAGIILRSCTDGIREDPEKLKEFMHNAIMESQGL